MEGDYCNATSGQRTLSARCARNGVHPHSRPVSLSRSSSIPWRNRRRAQSMATVAPAQTRTRRREEIEANTSLEEPDAVSARCPSMRCAESRCAESRCVKKRFHAGVRNVRTRIKEVSLTLRRANTCREFGRGCDRRRDPDERWSHLLPNATACKSESVVEDGHASLSFDGKYRLRFLGIIAGGTQVIVPDSAAVGFSADHRLPPRSNHPNLSDFR